MNHSLRLTALLILGLTFLALPSSSLAGVLTLKKVPALTVEQTPSYPENLARYHAGALIEATPRSHPIAHLQISSNAEDRNAAEAALLCDDPTVGYALPPGKSTILVSLSKIENVGRISFLNTGARGGVTIATSSAKLSADSPQWRSVAEQALSSNTVEANIGGGEAKYVRLNFDVTEPGRIAAFGIYATPQVSDFTAPRMRKLPLPDKSDSFALISYNLTDIHAKARALYVSSGADLRQANNMIDDQTSSTFSFATEDGMPTAVVDLGKPSTLRRLSAIYSPQAGKMEFYLLSSLPGATASSGSVPPQSAPETTTFDEAALSGLKVVGSVEDDGTRGRASVDFPATSARYVMVRWTPAAPQATPFALAEVAAFGGAGQNNTLFVSSAQASSAIEETSENTSDGKTALDGKTLIDTKEVAEPASPGEGPPPSLPQPPPFTFVPVLVPTSP